MLLELTAAVDGALVMVTHDLQLAARCDQQYRLVSVFGEPSMSRANGVNPQVFFVSLFGSLASDFALLQRLRKRTVMLSWQRIPASDAVGSDVSSTLEADVDTGRSLVFQLGFSALIPMLRRPFQRVWCSKLNLPADVGLVLRSACA